MTDDLVERLRKWPDEFSVMDVAKMSVEAADEIDQLRASVKKIWRAAEMQRLLRGGFVQADEAEDAWNEAEKL